MKIFFENNKIKISLDNFQDDLKELIFENTTDSRYKLKTFFIAESLFNKFFF